MLKTVMTLLLLFVAQPLYADVATGQELHDTHCISCHAGRFEGDETRIYTRPNRRVKDYNGLISMVTQCRDRFDHSWFDDETLDVVNFLNQEYYHYPSP